MKNKKDFKKMYKMSDREIEERNRQRINEFTLNLIRQSGSQQEELPLYDRIAPPSYDEVKIEKQMEEIQKRIEELKIIRGILSTPSPQKVDKRVGKKWECPKCKKELALNSKYGHNKKNKKF